MWRSVGPLLWKHWRVKQRESRLNRGRTRWLLPPLLTDVLLPLVLLLFVVRMMCQYNIVSPNSPYSSQRDMREVPQWSTSILPFSPKQVSSKNTASMLVAGFPKSVSMNNQSIALVDRQVNRDFIKYLDKEYPSSEELGFPSFTSLAAWIPIPKSDDESALVESIKRYAQAADRRVNVGLDLKQARHEKSSSYELLALMSFDLDDNDRTTSKDQVERYYIRKLQVNSTSDIRELIYPGILPLQMEANLYLRSISGLRLDHPSPERACSALDTVLKSGNLAWEDLPPLSPLGHSQDACEKAVAQSSLSKQVTTFLRNLEAKMSSSDTLRSLDAKELPSRPKTVVQGALESNIVVYMTYYFLWPYVRLVRDIVSEKESQQKEYLLIMGLSPTALLLSWFLLYWFAGMIITAIATYMLSGIMFASGSLSFVILLSAFATTMLLFAIAITPLFTQTKTAAASAPLLYILLSSAPFLRSILGEEVVASSWIASSLLYCMEQVSAPVVFMEALHGIVHLDATTGSIRAVDWSQTVAPTVIYMAWQGAGYLVLGWYLERVFPRSYGAQEPWYFALSPTYWFPSWFAHTQGQEEDETLLESVGSRQDKTIREISLEETKTRATSALVVSNLSKTYTGGTEALKDVSFSIRKGEIFSLLGRNGSGKSTCMNVICGSLSPSKGDVIVGDARVSKDASRIRQSLSVCFQQNVLFPTLTVEEHLYLVCALKQSLGVRTVPKDGWIRKLETFGLVEKRYALASTLSGGQKRKLSLVLALLDDAHVVLLDEPTAGMDLKARVDTWEALRAATQQRAVILTTHSMQEAQALCENIGILVDGELKCCGSSLFLREKFGVGYKLKVVHDDADRRTKDELTEMIRSYVPEAEEVSDNKWETRVQLGTQATNIPSLLRELDKRKEKGEMKQYSIVATDLEDVFVNVTEGGDVYHHVDAEKWHSSSSGREKNIESSSSMLQKFKTQLAALVRKRLKVAGRERRALFSQYFWPLAIFTIILGVLHHAIGEIGQVEDVTQLPASAFDKSFLVSSPSSLETSVRQIVDDVRTHPDRTQPVMYQSAATTDEMISLVLNKYNDTSLFAGVFISSLDAEASELEYTVYYNRSVHKSLPVTIQWLSTAFCPQGHCDLTVKQGTLNSFFTSEQNREGQKAMDTLQRILIAFYLLITVSSIASYYITQPVREKEGGLKRLQYLHLASSSSSFLYWLSTFAFDFVCFSVAMSVLALAVVIFPLTAMPVLGVWIVALLAFGFAVLPFLYLLSLVFASHSSAQSYLSYFSYFQILAASVIFALDMIPTLCTKVQTFDTVLRVLPLYTLSIAVLQTAAVEWTMLRKMCVMLSSLIPGLTQAMQGPSMNNMLDQEELLEANASDMDSSTPSVWSWDVSGLEICTLLVLGAVYWLILLLLDQLQMYPTLAMHQLTSCLHKLLSLFQRQEHAPAHFDSVEAPSAITTADRVCKSYAVKPQENSEEMARDENVLRRMWRNLSGTSSVLRALNDVSFRVEAGDCVALLGINGSGKSTMFEILTAGTSPTSGHAFIGGMDATLQPQESSTLYGYCPQPNVLFNCLTVREHLDLMLQLRKPYLSRRMQVDNIERTLRELALHPVEHTTAEHLSGGNKRRLMLSLALLCDSDRSTLFLLDEPSAGVDVVARRLMWHVLQRRQREATRASCLFTTHSMEEAEAVCANAVVLYKGRVAWSGSIPELKQRVSRGVSITISLDESRVWTPAKVYEWCQLARQCHLVEPAAVYNDELIQVLDAVRNCSTYVYDESSDAEWANKFMQRFGQEGVKVELEDFVKAWMMREAFAKVEQELFKLMTSRSGEQVKRAEEEASGSHNTMVYETNCSDMFGLADVFELLEEEKEEMMVTRYSVSELSLERVFEQFT